MRLALAISLLVAVVSQSQPPTPSGAATTGNQQQAGSEKQSQAATTQQPAIPVPTVNAPQPAPPQFVIQQSNGKQQRSATGNNLVAVIVSILTLGVLGAQVWVMFTQSRITARQNAIMEGQSAILDGQRAAIQVQGDILGKQLIATEKAANAALDSAKATKEALVLTHRPRVIVRNVVAPTLLQLSASMKLGGEIWVANTGGTHILGLRMSATWLVADKLPMEHPLSHVPTIKRINRLGPGRSYPIKLTERDIANDFEAFEATQGGVKSLYIIGLIKYFDELGQMRRTGFCRRWSPSVKRFEIVQDTDYEYAD